MDWVEMKTIEFRCPEYPTQLFGKSQVDEIPAAGQQEFEFACRQCKRNMRINGMVLHWFGADGTHLRTTVLERKRQTPTVQEEMQDRAAG